MSAPVTGASVWVTGATVVVRAPAAADVVVATGPAAGAMVVAMALRAAAVLEMSVEVTAEATGAVFFVTGAVIVAIALVTGAVALVTGATVVTAARGAGAAVLVVAAAAFSVFTAVPVVDATAGPTVFPADAIAFVPAVQGPVVLAPVTDARTVLLVADPLALARLAGTLVAGATALAIGLAAVTTLPVALESGEDELSAKALGAQTDVAPSTKTISEVAARTLIGILRIPLFVYPHRRGQSSMWGGFAVSFACLGVRPRRRGRPRRL